MAHSEIRVMKEAQQQLKKAASWIEPLGDVETIDQELYESAMDAIQHLQEEITRALVNAA